MCIRDSTHTHTHTRTQVYKLCGMDRVMVYKFHPDMHGEVVEEFKMDYVPESLLGLHYPATDIPRCETPLLLAVYVRDTAVTSRIYARHVLAYIRLVTEVMDPATRYHLLSSPPDALSSAIISP